MLSSQSTRRNHESGSRRGKTSPIRSLLGALGTAVSLVAASVATAQQAPEGNARGPIGPSPYDIQSLWHKPFAEPGFAFGGNSGVWAESPDRIIIAQRGETVLPYPIKDDFLGFA
ncbi:hypothetical protein OAD56_03710, partial [Gammaproteobacteria bacterium]|nr:hypothetical protein [Gammaproteobacteria bacterium]